MILAIMNSCQILFNLCNKSNINRSSSLAYSASASIFYNSFLFKNILKYYFLIFDINQSKILKKHQFNTTKNTLKNNKKKKALPNTDGSLAHKLSGVNKVEGISRELGTHQN
jgi:hypothetical protein